LERRHILFEPEPAQPFGHIHRSYAEAVNLRNHYKPRGASCLGCLAYTRARSGVRTEGTLVARRFEQAAEPITRSSYTARCARDPPVTDCGSIARLSPVTIQNRCCRDEQNSMAPLPILTKKLAFLVAL
jgi:hypothetical protein